MIPGVFDYHAPSTLDEAIALLGQHGDDSKLFAGGHSLLPMMKLRFAEPTHLIDLNKIDELKGIGEQGGVIRVGAMTTENELILSDVLAAKCPLLIDVAKSIGDPQVRNRGTIGGDITHGDPGNDHPAAMLALDASFTLKGPGGERSVSADGFFLGTYMNDLQAGEIMTAIEIPVPGAGSGYGFNKLKRKAGDFATAASTVVLQMKGGECEEIRIALTNVAPCAIRAEGAENELRGATIDDKLIEVAAQKVMEACNPADDQRGSPEYKTHMAAEMTRRSIRDALTRAKR